MEVSGQLHDLAALPPVKMRSMPIRQEAGWAAEVVWTLWRREISLSSTGTRTPSLQLVASLYTD
jgi:hypothetical protein